MTDSTHCPYCASPVIRAGTPSAFDKYFCQTEVYGRRRSKECLRKQAAQLIQLNETLKSLLIQVCAEAPESSFAQTVRYDIPKADNPTVGFAGLMFRELLMNQHKGPWDDWNPNSQDLTGEIDHHLSKLKNAISMGDEFAVTEFAADVANLCQKAHSLFGSGAM